MTIEREAEKGTLCGPERLLRVDALFQEVGRALRAYLADGSRK
jgi:hypothetical protein